MISNLIYNIYTVIVTFNGEKWIEKCLNSLNSSTVQTTIIIIDNNSSDTTTSIIKEKYPDVQLVQSPENLGFGKANNIGIKKANKEGANYIFLLNQDAWVRPETIENLITISNKYPEFCLLSPAHLNKEGTNFDKGFMNYALPPFCDHFFFDSFSSNKKEIYDTNFVNAAAWLLKMNTILEIGVFDPIFYHYGEDKDYCNRLKFHKKSIGIVPSALIFHSRESPLITNTGFIQNQKRKIYKNYFSILVELKRLDLNLNRQALRFVFSLIKSSIKNLLSLKFEKSINNILVIIKIFIDYSTILQHRKISLCKEAFIHF